jgi:hypothetical protein
LPTIRRLEDFEGSGLEGLVVGVGFEDFGGALVFSINPGQRSGAVDIFKPKISIEWKSWRLGKNSNGAGEK